MMWMLRDKCVTMALHYSDDFLVVGPPRSSDCEQSLKATLALCAELGFPVTSEKTEGPTSRLTFLGIEIDSVGGRRNPPSPG